jgi:hypothetical protein
MTFYLDGPIFGGRRSDCQQFNSIHAKLVKFSARKITESLPLYSHTTSTSLISHNTIISNSIRRQFSSAASFFHDG